MTNLNRTELVEALASLEHDQWMRWAQTLMEKEPLLSAERVARWKSLMVPYTELSEEMKEFDREWARKALAIALPPDPQPQTGALRELRAKAAEALGHLDSDDVVLQSIGRQITAIDRRTSCARHVLRSLLAAPAPAEPKPVADAERGGWEALERLRDKMQSWRNRLYPEQSGDGSELLRAIEEADEALDDRFVKKDPAPKTDHKSTSFDLYSSQPIPKACSTDGCDNPSYTTIDNTNFCFEHHWSELYGDKNTDSFRINMPSENQYLLINKRRIPSWVSTLSIVILVITLIVLGILYIGKGL